VKAIVETLTSDDGTFSAKFASAFFATSSDERGPRAVFGFPARGFELPRLSRLSKI
jgi:hypothetical protein